MVAKPLRTKPKSASAERCLRSLGATIDMATPDMETSNCPVRGVLSHGGLRKGNQEVAVITGFYRSPGIAGIEVKIEFGLCAGLAIAQTRKLFGVAKEKFDLKTRLVIAIEPLGLQGDIRAEEHGIAVTLGMDHDHHLEIALQLHVVEHLMVQHDMLVFGIEALKAR